MSLFTNETATATRRWPRRVLASTAWLSLGALLAWTILANPLGLHALDGLRNRVLGLHPAEVAPDQKPKQLWTCGMHPQIVQDHPGTCPICGMNLVPMRADARPAKDAAADERRVLFYRNPMNPTVTSPVPMKDEMGMDYVPVYEDQAEGTAEGGATVTIDPSIVQNMNVLTQAATRGDLTREIRTVGYLQYDQQKVVTVTTKYSGWIEKVYVNYLGEPVKKGQALFEIYAPTLVQTEQDLLTALEFARRMQDATPEARLRAQDLVAAARQRLSYWDITPAQVERLESTGTVFRTLTVASPAGGLVMMRMPGLEGMAVKPGMELMHIADLSSLWLSVEAFEDQIGWLRVGSEAEVSLRYFPRESFKGRIRYIEPQVNEKTRTVPLKLEVPNADGRLRAGMYATVGFHPAVAKDAVLVPSLAVLRTGRRNLVIVAEEGGRFTPHEVALGAEGGGQVEIVSGLDAGQRVVTSAQFLIDSESNLREAVQKLLAGRGSGEAAGAAPAHQH
ncbi:MAG: efflux RND transporter periplasmic adaptor subunit [Vicinamibacteria bacterium]|jgi:Cu(I)/Ag(I) efflux system membrane fusion protein/cobalt-zinc-cadmium efflux system membrane fusion protein|nr:efflux RND transporter periplasmic adaptor subunit [Vicinamibacteria bacterium]